MKFCRIPQKHGRRWENNCRKYKANWWNLGREGHEFDDETAMNDAKEDSSRDGCMEYGCMYGMFWWWI
jgi:hypothetical protein